MSAVQPSELTGKLLIAMPGIGDSRFENAIVYLCAHSSEGAMGLMINRPSTDVKADDVLEQLEIDIKDDMAPLSVHLGGPVEMGRGFVLHDGGYALSAATLEVDKDFAMTASQEILRDIAQGGGPENRLLCLGYSGWGPGQLEEEMVANGWLICEASPKLVFGLHDDEKWEAALATIGVDPALLSADAGHA